MSIKAQCNTCTFCGADSRLYFCPDCGNKLSRYLGGKLRFQNLRELNMAVFADKDDTVDICFDLLNPAGEPAFN